MKDQALTIALTSIFFCVFVVSFFGFLLFYFKKFYKLTSEKKELKLLFENELSNSQLEIQEQIFNTISQEIHDNVGQLLCLVKVQLNILDHHDNTDKTLLKDTKENVNKAMTDLRDIAKGLSGDRIRDIGIIKSIEQEIERINRIGILTIDFKVHNDELKINNQKELILFRVLQECIQNIIKHASADSVSIAFTFSPDTLQISITDNGKGFNFYQEKKEMYGLGIQNIYKRTEMIGGKVEFESIPLKGTTVKIEVPYV